MSSASHDDPIPGWRLRHRGKVRRPFEAEDGRCEHLLLVADDRISAFDRELDLVVPGKGRTLTAQSRWWFARLDFPNHLVQDGRACPAIPRGVVDSAQLVHRLEMVPVECVVRGYLVGSAWKEYRSRGTVAGARLPAGLDFGASLPAPVFAPTSKGVPGSADVPLSDAEFERRAGGVGGRLRSASLDLYRQATAHAASRGLVVLDTKFEFGLDGSTGALTLGDEALTGDSSRFAVADEWSAGVRDRPLGKQILRDRLAASPGEAGETVLDQEFVRALAASYAELSRLLGAA